MTHNESKNFSILSPDPVSSGGQPSIRTIWPKPFSTAGLAPAVSANYGAGWTVTNSSIERVLFIRRWNLNVAFAPLPELGIAGQDWDDPPSQFTSHYVITHGGKIYDPSYGGNAYDNLIAWENASLSATGVTFRRVKDGEPFVSGKWVYQANATDAEDTYLGADD